MKSYADKKVLFIAYQIPPIGGPAAQRHIRFLIRLPEFRWKPLVLTVAPQYCEDYYPIDSSLCSIIPENINIYRTKALNLFDKLNDLKTFLYQDKKKAKLNYNDFTNEKKRGGAVTSDIKDFFSSALRYPDRQIGWYKFAMLKGAQLILNNKVDILYTSGNPWTTHLVGLTLSTFFNKPWVADFRDPWTQNPYKEKRHRLFEKMDCFFEHKVVQQASYVICNTKPLLNQMWVTYPRIPHEKFVHISNGYLDSLFRNLNSEKSDKRFVITHAGTLYAKRSPLALFQAISNLKEKGILSQDRFVLKLIGKNEFTEAQYDILFNLNITELIELIPPVAHDKALEYLAQSDILLIIQPETELQIPGKLFEYIAIGKPVLGLTGKGATADFIHEARLGTCVDYNDVAQIEKFIFEVIEYDNKRPLMGCSLSHKEKFESYSLTHSLTELFDKLTSNENSES